MINRNSSKVIIFFTILVIISCGKEKEDMSEKRNIYKKIEDIQKESWDKLSTKKIFFGHQSAGYNVIDGIRNVMEKYPEIKLNIIETNNGSKFNNGFFAHFKIGKNTYPETKIDDFMKYIEDGMGDNVDIAFFKLCYVDIKNGTDIEKVFNQYREKMNYLSNRYPRTKFIHMTVPVNSNPVGIKLFLSKIKNLVKSILGKENMDNNVVKHIFNEKLRELYGKSGHLFDLALSESTTHSILPYNNNDNFSKINELLNEYTDDGGHLNKFGQDKVAKDFLMFLITI